MGLIDRFAARVASEIVKAPAGAVPISDAQLRNSVLNQNSGYGTQVPLERDPGLAAVPFSPGNPLIPGAINPLDPARGRPDPRRYEFLVAQNINITETRLIPFKTLRAAGDQIDILRRCIEVLKSKISSLDWDITLSDSASEKIISESGGNHLQAMDKARVQFAPEIDRLVDFWRMPDIAEGLTFSEWLKLALEEILVLDAWAIWPQKTVGGDLQGFKILDGSTIKPLISDTGFRPTPPNPAYQQILYGFPRTEFMATDDRADADGEFTSDDLIYNVYNRRTWTVYGYSPVERSLMIADIYLRRQQWIRAEYTDGVIPEMMFETDATFGNNPELLKAYENIFNDDLSGQTEQRKRARLLPAGIKAVQFDGYGEKFKDVLDDYLVTSICGHFGVMPTEIGFTPKGGGLGGKGHQEGEAGSAQAIGVDPLARWLSDILTNLSHTFLGMPRELEFRLMPAARENTEEAAKRDDIVVRNAGKSVNEHRSELGLPLLDTPEADMPILVAGQSVFLFSPEGMIAAGTTLDENGAPEETEPQTSSTPPETSPKPVETSPEKPETLPAAKSAHDEIRAFMRWARKGNTSRPFNFESVEPTYADVLNKFVEAKDFDGARWYAERYLGL